MLLNRIDCYTVAFITISPRDGGLMRPKTSSTKSQRREADRHIDVVQKALEILDVFDSMAEVNLKQISESTGITANRAIRILGTLESKGYVSRSADTRTYRLGYRALALGKSFEKHNNLTSISRPVLKQIVSICGESASLFVVSGGMRMVLAREEGTHGIRFAVTEGQRMPLHAGAGGKILLAFGEKKLLDQTLAKQELIAITERTITDKAQLIRTLASVREKGYAISQGERIRDSRAIAVPVFGHDGLLVGALGIGGPESRLQGERLQKSLDLLIDAARSLSKMLGWESATGCPLS